MKGMVDYKKVREDQESRAQAQGVDGNLKYEDLLKTAQRRRAWRSKIADFARGDGTT